MEDKKLKRKKKLANAVLEEVVREMHLCICLGVGINLLNSWKIHLEDNI